MKLLEQALVDAKELKEAAIKNAEKIILEKYSDKINESVYKILTEQEDFGDEENLGGEEDVSVGDDMSFPEISDNIESVIAKESPLAAIEDEEMEGSISDEGIVEIDFGELEKQMAMSDNEPDEMKSSEEVSDEIFDLEDEEFGDEENLGEVPREEGMEGSDEEDSFGDIDTELLEGVLKELEVEMEPIKSGYSKTNNLEQKVNNEIDKIKDVEEPEEETEEKEEDFEELVKENKKIKFELFKIKETINTLKEEKEKIVKQNLNFKNILLQAKDKLEEINLSNAKLIYQNKVLENESFNGRQKSRIVESISNSDSIESVKTIYKTLLSASGSIKSNEPKSINEAISRRSELTSLLRNKEKNEMDDEEIQIKSKMQRMAGIKNK